MEIAYCNGSISTSETFIFDLINGLCKKDHVEFLAGKPAIKAYNFSYTNTGFLQNGADGIISRKINSLLGDKIIFRRKMKFATKKIRPYLKNKNVAFLEYGTTAVLLREALKRENVPYIVHFHGFDITSQLNNTAYKKDLKKVFAEASFVIAASHHIRRLLTLEGCPVEKIRVVRIGLNHVKEWKVGCEKTLFPSIIFVGRLTPKKNPKALILAFDLVRKKLPNAILTLVGDGPLYQDCIELIKKLGLGGSVNLLGALERSEALKILQNHWLYAQHSVTSFKGDQEGFGVSLAEAAFLGLPVVSTFHNGIPENVLHGQSGFLVKEFDYESMAEHMIEILQNSEMRGRMGEAGHNHISQLCNQDERVNTIYDLLKKASK